MHNGRIKKIRIDLSLPLIILMSPIIRAPIFKITSKTRSIGIETEPVEGSKGSAKMPGTTMAKKIATMNSVIDKLPYKVFGRIVIFIFNTSY